MSDGEIKQVTVSLSHPDELNPRRRRRTRKFKDDVDSQSGGVLASLESSSTNTNNVPVVTVQKEIPTTTVSSVPNSTPIHSTNPVQNVAAPIQPAPVLSAVTMVGGAATPGGVVNSIQIRDKKNKTPQSSASGTPMVSELNALNAPSSTAMPKIIPHKKRLINAPLAQTLKKPKFVISAPAAAPAPTPAPAPQNSSHAPPLPASIHENPIRKTVRGVGGEEDANLKTVGGGARRRRFTERRIKIEVKPIVKTRKNRKVLKEHIDSMPIQTVRRLLIKKGLLKPKTTVPPEPMLRSMLHDYYLLKQNE
jgi:hypothetical protein